MVVMREGNFFEGRVCREEEELANAFYDLGGVFDEGLGVDDVHLIAFKYL